MPWDPESQRKIQFLMRSEGISYEEAYRRVAEDGGKSDQESALDNLVDGAAGPRLLAESVVPDAPDEPDEPDVPEWEREPEKPLHEMAGVSEEEMNSDYDPYAKTPKRYGEADMPAPKPLHMMAGVKREEMYDTPYDPAKKKDRLLVDNLLRSQEDEIEDAPFMSEQQKRVAATKNRRRREILADTYDRSEISDRYANLQKKKFAYQETNDRMAKYLHDMELYDPETGELDEARMAEEHYIVRAWVEKQKVLSGEGIEGPGDSGKTHTSWGHGESRRHERMMKTAHFNTGGHVVPHPEREGDFIIVRANGTRVESLGGAGNPLSRAAALERNKRRIDEQPHRYIEAFTKSDDRKRRVAARRHPSLLMRIAMQMDMPPHSPSVLREYDRVTTGGLGSRPQGRYWQGRTDRPLSINGPSSNDAYTAAYFNPSEGGKSGSPPKADHWKSRPSKAEYEAQTELSDAHNDLAEAKGDWDEATDAASQLAASERIDAAKARLKAGKRRWRATGSGSMAGYGPEGREDLRRADLRGHFSKKMRGPMAKSGDPWQVAKGVGRLRRLQDEWNEWMAPDEPEPVSPAAAGEYAPESPVESVDTGVPNPAAVERAGGRMPARDNVTETGPSAGRREWEDKVPQLSEPDAAEEYSPSGAVSDHKQLAPPRPRSERPEEVPIGPEIDLTDRDVAQKFREGQESGRIKPYQPTVGPDGEIVYKPLDISQYAADVKFDKMFSEELFQLRENMQSTDIKGEDSWWSGTLEAFNIRESHSLDKKWFDTFVTIGTEIVTNAGYPTERAQLDVIRWGDRHLSSSARYRKAPPNQKWDRESPILKRGRKPSSTGTGHENLVERVTKDGPWALGDSPIPQIVHDEGEKLGPMIEDYYEDNPPDDDSTWGNKIMHGAADIGDWLTEQGAWPSRDAAERSVRKWFEDLW